MSHAEPSSPIDALAAGDPATPEGRERIIGRLLQGRARQGSQRSTDGNAVEQGKFGTQLVASHYDGSGSAETSLHRVDERLYRESASSRGDDEASSPAP